MPRDIIDLSNIQELIFDPTQTERKDFEYATYEYSGPPRTGKSTLMVADIIRLLNPTLFNDYYSPDEVYCNFPLYIPGVHCFNNDNMLKVLLKARKEKWTHKVIAIDECSQPPLFYARGYKDDTQTQLVTAFWQMPKLRCMSLISSNVGNSIDVQMRDATIYEVLPIRYIHNPQDRTKEFIIFRIVHNYEIWTTDYILKNPYDIQKYFDSSRPVI